MRTVYCTEEDDTEEDDTEEDDTEEEEGGYLDEQILVFTFADASKQKLLQVVRFQTKCNGDLALGDIYCSLQLMSFTNDEMSASVYKNITFEVTITKVGTDELRTDRYFSIVDQQETDDVVLGNSNNSSEKSILDEMTVDLTFGAGSEKSILQEVTVDLMHPRTIKTSITIDGKTSHTGQVCQESADMSLVVPGRD